MRHSLKLLSNLRSINAKPVKSMDNFLLGTMVTCIGISLVIISFGHGSVYPADYDRSDIKFPHQNKD